MTESREISVYLAGEGRTELGSYASHRSYWEQHDIGVLATLLRQVKASGWKVSGARTWKSIKKLRIPRAEHEDTRNVQAVALDAREGGCQVLVFSRDADGDDGRHAAVEKRIELAIADGALRIAGAVAIPLMEAWLLALSGGDCMPSSRRTWQRFQSFWTMSWVFIVGRTRAALSPDRLGLARDTCRKALMPAA